ncbi:hypothetical protein F7725_022524 [Dissostichus mawsoni]|uniref:Uncharacterized protein n=1 Tax=Dissostichus mawsoni TaxID=36200 RepID=A0A7J5Z0S8_DISMA|nr:hypothetical protein F7725_022422 [Dissostichus mawsoni]KAF3854469.1 hypothetical protein F7725_022524 [Dissostichus mawsoni]
MESLKNDIFGKIDASAASLHSEILSVRQELKSSVEPLQHAKRAAFVPVKRTLHSYPNVKFGLLFPATLKITMPNGTSHRFEDPTVATDFVNKNCK